MIAVSLMEFYRAFAPIAAAIEHNVPRHEHWIYMGTELSPFIEPKLMTKILSVTQEQLNILTQHEHEPDIAALLQKFSEILNAAYSGFLSIEGRSDPDKVSRFLINVAKYALRVENKTPVLLSGILGIGTAEDDEEAKRLLSYL